MLECLGLGCILEQTVFHTHKAGATKVANHLDSRVTAASGEDPCIWMYRSGTTGTELNLDIIRKYTNLDRGRIRRHAEVQRLRCGMVGPIVTSRTFEKEDVLAKMAVKGSNR
uniref:Uncharacterized protein n=1 Tax=Opuntia streptacantha TaxID=393608 RepID=A0A7C9B2F5_OPUST